MRCHDTQCGTIARGALAVLCLLLSGAAAHGETPYADLLSWVPVDANTLVMISVSEARVSPFAQREFSNNEAARSAIGAHVFAAPGVDYAVLASSLDLATMKPAWDIALLAGNRSPSLEDIARRHQGRVERLGSVPAVWLPPGSFLVQLGSQTFGMMTPGDRQFVARWLRTPREKGAAHLSSYLQEAAAWPDAVGTEIILALDLQDALSPTTLAERLAKSDALAARRGDLPQIAKLLASVRGITLGVRTTSKASARLRVDFAADPSLLGASAKPLLLEVLARRGAVIEDVYNWNAEIKGNTVFFGGELSAKGLQRVLSLVDPPASPVEQQEAEPSPGSDPVARASLSYFRALQAILEDVRTPDADRMITSGQYAMWFEKYAKKIDQMPTLNVDPDLLDYAAGVASTLRSFAYGQRDVGFQGAKHSNNLQLATGSWGNYDNDDWGDSYNRGPSAATIAKRMARTSAAESQSSGFHSLDDATAKMRRMLTDRYKVQF